MSASPASSPIGAYTSALLTTPDTAGHFGGFDLPIVVGWLAAMAAAGIAAAITGVATLRLKSDYLAITTFGVAVVVQLVALNAQRADRRPLRHRLHSAALRRPCRDAAALQPLQSRRRRRRDAALAYLALERLARSPWGRVLRRHPRGRARRDLARQERHASTACRPSPWAARSWGSAGAVQAHFIGFIAPDNYLPILTFQVWTMLIVGGSGSNRGAIVGGVLVWAIWAGSGALTSILFAPEQQARAASLQIVAIGVMLCVILLVRPSGLFGDRPRRTRLARQAAKAVADQGSATP